jgi:hypothetical protein
MRDVDILKSSAKDEMGKMKGMNISSGRDLEK